MQAETTPRFSAVLFDCDGVLVDSEPIANAVLREMLQELGWDISDEEAIRRFVGRSFIEEWKVIYATRGTGSTRTGSSPSAPGVTSP